MLSKNKHFIIFRNFFNQTYWKHFPCRSFSNASTISSIKSSLYEFNDIEKLNTDIFPNLNTAFKNKMKRDQKNSFLFKWKRIQSKQDSQKLEVYAERGDVSASRSIYLNRVNKSNSLNLAMIRLLSDNLTIYEEHSNIRALFLRGIGEHFCRGRDHKDFWSLLCNKKQKLKNISSSQFNSNINSIAKFLIQEYRLVHKIAMYNIPIAVCMHGELVSSGIGLSMHCPVRLAAHSAKFSFVECEIGWIPEGGASQFLPRLKVDGAGLWLALTGTKIDAQAMRTFGIATHLLAYPENLDDISSRFGERVFLKKDYMRRNLYFAVSEYDDVEAEHNPIMDQLWLIELCFGSHHTSLDSIFSVLEQLSQGKLRQVLQAYNKNFVFNQQQSLKHSNKHPDTKILKNKFEQKMPPALRYLQSKITEPSFDNVHSFNRNKNSDFCPFAVIEQAKKQLYCLGKMSSLSLLATFNLIKQGSKAKTLENCLNMEFDVAMAMLKHSEFTDYTKRLNHLKNFSSFDSDFSSVKNEAIKLLYMFRNNSKVNSPYNKQNGSLWLNDLLPELDFDGNIRFQSKTLHSSPFQQNTNLETKTGVNESHLLTSKDLNIYPKPPLHNYIYPPINSSKFSQMGGSYEQFVHNQFMKKATLDNMYLSNPNPVFLDKLAELDKEKKETIESVKDKIDEIMLLSSRNQLKPNKELAKQYQKKLKQQEARKRKPI